MLSKIHIVWPQAKENPNYIPTAFISFVKKEALKRGLTEIRGTALIENMASRRVMEKNGGVLESAYDNGATYVIPLQKER